MEIENPGILFAGRRFIPGMGQPPEEVNTFLPVWGSYPPNDTVKKSVFLFRKTGF
jgi:hypothetical protein